MNEPSNFDTNIYPDKLQCAVNKWDDPPYETSQSITSKKWLMKWSQYLYNCFCLLVCRLFVTVAAHTGTVKRLSDKTICMNTRQGNNGEYLHYDVHSLYGYSEAIATEKYVPTTQRYQTRKQPVEMLVTGGL